MELLPEESIATAISFTTPRDACRLASVSTFFKSAAESDVVWERFLPPDYPSLISNSASSSSLRFSSKKELFFSLCHNPILIDEGKKSFSLDKQSGKKCYMISARDLSIVWGDTPSYWIWHSIPEARFSDVAELISVCWLEIRGQISTRSLSPGTLYTAYLVYRPTIASYGFDCQPVEVTVGLVGSESPKRTVFLYAEGVRMWPKYFIRRITYEVYNQHSYKPKEIDGNYPKERGDDWLEIELGDFFNEGDEVGELEMSVMEVVSGHWKAGLIVQGIEIRPKWGK